MDQIIIQGFDLDKIEKRVSIAEAKVESYTTNKPSDLEANELKNEIFKLRTMISINKMLIAINQCTSEIELNIK